MSNISLIKEESPFNRLLPFTGKRLISPQRFIIQMVPAYYTTQDNSDLPNGLGMEIETTLIQANLRAVATRLCAIGLQNKAANLRLLLLPFLRYIVRGTAFQKSNYAAGIL